MTCEKCKYEVCEHQCMNLPDGTTCADCSNLPRCEALFGVKPQNTKCDFEPIRFKPKKEVTQ